MTEELELKLYSLPMYIDLGYTYTLQYLYAYEYDTLAVLKPIYL